MIKFLFLLSAISLSGAAQDLDAFKKKIKYSTIERPVSITSNNDMIPGFAGAWPSLGSFKINGNSLRFVSSSLSFNSYRSGTIRRMNFRIFSKEGIDHSLVIECFVGRDYSVAENDFFESIRYNSRGEIAWERHSNELGEITIVGEGERAGKIANIKIKKDNYVITISTSCPDVDVEPLAKFLFNHAEKLRRTNICGLNPEVKDIKITPSGIKVGQDVSVAFIMKDGDSGRYILQEKFSGSDFRPVNQDGLIRTLRPLHSGKLLLKYVIIDKETQLYISGNALVQVED